MTTRKIDVPDGMVAVVLPETVKVPLTGKPSRDAVGADHLILPLTALTAETIATCIMHGAKQKVNDSVSSPEVMDADTKAKRPRTAEEYRKALAAAMTIIVENRWNPGSRGDSLDPIEKVILETATATWKRLGRKMKELTGIVEEHGVMVAFMTAYAADVHGKPTDEALAKAKVAATNESNITKVRADAEKEIARRAIAAKATELDL